MRSHTDYLAQNGFYAVSFDPPGTWESPGDISLYTMTNYIQAVNELIAHFGNRPTLLVGHSRGSSIATLIGISNPHVEAFVSVMCSLSPSAYTSLGENITWQQTGYQDEYRDPPGGGPETKHLKLPYSFYQDQRRYDLKDGLQTCTKPKLFIYGTRDEIATPQKVKSLYDVASSPRQIYELNSDHDYRLHPHLITEVNDAIGSFVGSIATPWAHSPK
jgi:pimeloyl-ACP methyl ester carboxylesterase